MRTREAALSASSALFVRGGVLPSFFPSTRRRLFLWSSESELGSRSLSLSVGWHFWAKTRAFPAQKSAGLKTAPVPPNGSLARDEPPSRTRDEREREKSASGNRPTAVSIRVSFPTLVSRSLVFPTVADLATTESVLKTATVTAYASRLSSYRSSSHLETRLKPSLKIQRGIPSITVVGGFRPSPQLAREPPRVRKKHAHKREPT